MYLNISSNSNRINIHLSHINLFVFHEVRPGQACKEMLSETLRKLLSIIIILGVY